MQKRRRLTGNAGDRIRQQRLRDRRKAEGWRRVTVWLSPEQVDSLETLGGDEWLGREVKRLLNAAMELHSPVSGNATLAELERLRTAGLSWAAIARQWNALGRRSMKGGLFTSSNLARTWRTLKGGT